MFYLFRRKKKHHAKTNHWALIGVAATALGAALLVVIQVQRPFTGGGETQFTINPPSQFASLKVDFGDGTDREFRGEVVENLNAMDALILAANAGNLYLDYAPTPTGIKISAIGAKKADKKKNWDFYVNSKKMEDPAAYRIQAGDTIEWRYN